MSDAAVIALHARAQQVATVLGLTYNQAENTHEGRHLWYVKLHGPHHNLHVTAGDRGMDSWSGLYPRDRRGQDQWRSSDTCPGIQVSSAKTPEQIAADIRRRLLPKYLDMLAIVQQRIEAADAYADICQQHTTRLATLLNVKPSTRGDGGMGSLLHFMHGEIYGHAQISGASITLELRCLTIDQAEAVLHTLYRLPDMEATP